MEKIRFKRLKKPYIIAEIGGNHCADINLAKKGIFNAKKAGADCVKFQMYKHDTIVHPSLQLLPHVKSIAKEKTQSDRFKKLELSENNIIDLRKTALKHKINFAVTPFSTDFVKFLSSHVDFFKVASGDLNYFPMIEKIAKFNKDVVISSGMSDLNKIRETLKILKNNNVVLMHCISSYPTKTTDLNLNSIELLKKKTKLEIGFSDHTNDNVGSLIALGKGVKIFEKHFLPIDNLRKVGDYELSLTPKGMKKYCDELNTGFKALGFEGKKIFNAERKFLNNLCRSIYYSSNKKINSKISMKDLLFIRPFKKKGLDLKDYKKILGKKIKYKIKKFDLVQKKHFS